jgi:hypothetical protein
VAAVTSGASDLAIVPNPNNGSFQIKGTIAGSDPKVSLELRDLAGQVIYNKAVVANDRKLDEMVQLENTVARGIYILTVHSGSSSAIFQVVVAQ